MDSLVERMFQSTKRLLEQIVPALFAVLLLVICWQVGSRYLLRHPSTVTEELSRLLLMWLGILGSALTWAERKHMAIEWLQSRVQATTKVKLDRIIALCTSGFALTLLVGGVDLVRNAFQLSQMTPALGIPMGVVYLVLPLGGLCFLLCSLHFYLEAKD